MQPTAQLTKPGKQQWKPLAINGITASQVFNSAKYGAEHISRKRPLLNSNINITSVAEILRGVTAACNESHLGLTEYGSALCSGSPELCSLLTCGSLLAGSRINQIVAQSLMTRKPRLRRTKSDESFINATLDCESFKHLKAYHVMPPVSEQTSFPIAFSLFVEKSAFQVNMLLRALYRPQNLYCIHIDAKSSKTFTSAVHAIASCFENVFIASKLETVTRTGFSHLQANINCMQDLVNHETQWRYLLNAAGHAFPLKTVAEMVQVLQLYNGTNDIQGIDGKRVLRKRFEWEWVETNGTLRLTGRRNPTPPHNIEVVRGSAYGIFSREFVEFVLTDHRAVDLLAWSKLTMNPGEHYWATLHHTHRNPHLQTPGAYSGPPSKKPWLALYSQSVATKCHGKMVKNVCVLGIHDLPDLIQRREFFANKLSVHFEPLALQCLNAWIRQKESCPPPVFDFQFYSSLSFVKKNIAASFHSS